MSPPSSLTPPPPLDPTRARVLEVARGLLGQREIPKNRGPIVELVCRPFLAPRDFDRLYAAGKLAWCAGFACYCWLHARPETRGLASVDCDSLWLRLASKGLVRRAGIVDLAPQPADMIFFHARRDHGNLVHVGLVTRCEGKTVWTIEGNTRMAHDDTGSVGEKHYALTDPTIHGCASLL